MKRSAIYAKAARRIERGLDENTCIAVANVVGGPRRQMSYYTYQEVTDYTDMFEGSGDDLLRLFENEDDPRGCRVVALCFMAAIAESEGQ